MKEKTCEECGEIITRDIEEHRKKYPNQAYIQCPNCWELNKI